MHVGFGSKSAAERQNSSRCNVEAEIIVTRFIHRDPSLFLGKKIANKDLVEETYSLSPSKSIHQTQFA
eukprot:766154-Hanusia_phi.AAC.4